MSVKQDRVGARTVAELERKYQFNKKFSQMLGLIDDSRKEVLAFESRLTSEIEQTSTKLQRDMASISAEVASLSKTVAVKLDIDAVNLAITKAITDGKVDKVVTTTGRFDVDGLLISKTGEAIQNRLSHTGMYVTRNGEELLTANKDGVVAVDLKAKNGTFTDCNIVGGSIEISMGENSESLKIDSAGIRMNPGPLSQGYKTIDMTLSGFEISDIAAATHTTLTDKYVHFNDSFNNYVQSYVNASGLELYHLACGSNPALVRYGEYSEGYSGMKLLANTVIMAAGSAIENNQDNKIVIGQDPSAGNGIRITGYKISANKSIAVDSDRNLKHDIESLETKYSKLLDLLRPVRFKYNDDENENFHIGFIAQEVQAAMESAGITAEEFGGHSVGISGTQSLAYEEFIAVIIYELQKIKNQLKGAI